MADFNTHVFGAAAVISLGATCATKLLQLSMTDGLMLMAAGLIGGVLPDVDLRSSQPSKALFSMLGVVAGLLWLFSNLEYHTGIELWLGAIAVYLLVRFPLASLFHRITTHRGVLHSLIGAAMAGIVSCALAWNYVEATALQSWLVGISLAVGYLVHLCLDELYSVDFAGVQVRRSFGSALKILDLERLPASCLVIFITLVAWFWMPPYQSALAELGDRYHEWRVVMIPEWLH